MALVRVLSTMPQASCCYEDGDANRALLISEQQLVELRQDTRGVTLRVWPLGAVSKVEVGAASHVGVMVGLDPNSPLLTSLRDLQVTVTFDDDETLTVSGLETTGPRSAVEPEQAKDCADFLLALTRLTSTHCPVSITWPL
jgi:hypothetical protein